LTIQEPWQPTDSCPAHQAEAEFPLAVEREHQEHFHQELTFMADDGRIIYLPLATLVQAFDATLAPTCGST